jgi:hypothetical protein
MMVGAKNAVKKYRGIGFMARNPHGSTTTALNMKTLFVQLLRRRGA